jgi:hypothetical protein
MRDDENEESGIPGRSFIPHDEEGEEGEQYDTS